MIDYVKYQPEHLLSMSGHVLHVDGDIKEDIADLHAYFPATTAMLNGEPIACFGVHLLWEGTGEAWAAFREDLPDVLPKTLVGATRVALDTMSEMVDRLQATVEKSNKPAQRFAEHYGFKKEGVLRKYRNGKDFIMYSRVK